MKTLAFRLWESNGEMLDLLKRELGEKRKQVLSKNLILNEALKDLIQKEVIK